jgi:hypothetical protein
MAHPLEDIVRVAPAIWPGRVVPVQPGDLAQFAPAGLGLEGPFPMRPWDDPFGPSPGRYYGYQAPSGHPFLNAPLASPNGGTIYFDDHIARTDFETALRLMGVQLEAQFYALFIGHSTKPVEDRFLTQIRLVEAAALGSMFDVDAPPEAQAWVQQPLPLKDALWRFIELEREIWGSGMSRQLRGLFGGDGDWAKESLCFGFLVENNDQGIYRLWSRAWLVTK